MTGNKSMQVAVIGAGAAGLTAALRLAESGADVTIYERETVLGGLAASFALGGTPLERFYHHIFRSDRAIVRLINELGLSDRLLWLRPNTSVLVGGQRHQLDSPMSVLRFQPLATPDRLRLAASLAVLKLLPSPDVLSRSTAVDWLERWMGGPAYQTVWKPLLEQKFGEHAPEIGMPWFWARIHCRTTDLGYLRFGFAQLYERMGEAITARGGRIYLGRPIDAIQASNDGRPEVIVDGRPQVFDRVVATLPTRLFTRLAQGLPSEYQKAYDWGEAYGAHCLILALDRPLTDVYWLNINDQGYPFLALIEHTNLMPIEDYGGRHVIYLGNYLPMHHPRLRQPAEEVFAEYLPHLKRINPDFDRSWVKECYGFAAPFAQPIVTLDYPKHIPPFKTPLPGVYLANMFQVYPQDRGQNYSILLGERVAREVLTAA